MIAHATPQERLPELISRLGSVLREIDEATGGQVDALVDAGGQVSWLLRGAQEALVRQEQEFRALAENSADLILRVSPGLRVLYANPAALRVIGAPLEELRGRALPEMARGTPGVAGWTAALAEAAGTGQPREAEFTFGREPRTTVYHSRFTPEFGAGGELASVLAVSRDTTAIHASGRALAAAHALLEAVLRQLPVGVVIAEAPSGRLMMGNEQVDRIFGHGYRPSASIGEYGEWIAYHPDGRRVQSEEWPLSRALRTGVAAGPDEYHVHRADGTRGTARFSASPVMDAQGSVVAGVVVVADVTAQRAALDALRASDERFRLVNLATNDIIYDWNLAAGTLHWNAALGTLGHDHARVPRSIAWWDEQVHPDDATCVRTSLDGFLAGEGLFWSEDYRFRRADGSYARVYDRAHLVRGADGRPERMIGSMLDVSQRDAADAALHHQALLLDTVEQAVIATDLRGNITCWNRFAEELYGWKRDEVLGRPVLEVTPPEEMMHDAARSMERLSRGESRSGQFRLRRRDGSTFMAQVTDTPICAPSGELVGVVGVSFDITERRELEEQLRQSQKMDAVGQLAGGVAHDFNNLLTVIQGTVELLKADLPPADPVRDDIHQIGEAAERAASLTRQLLAFSRRQILKPRPVNLASLVSGLLPMLKRLIGEDVELRFQAGAAAAQAEADPGQLEQVLMNLVVNARDAIPAGGGRIVVETREVEVRAGDEGSDAGLAPGRYAVLAVRDSGTGMPEEVRRRVFEPFFTTKEPGKGTGLGLSTVYGIARQSDGHVFVDSAPGKGTEFRLYLPARAVPEPTVAEAEPLSATGTETVLLIEDEEAVRSLMRRVLARHGYTVLEARDGSEALELARVQADRIDLVISDVVMPGRSGPSAAGEISEIAGGAPVLYISGYTDDEILRRGIRTADTHFLQKPFSPHTVLAQVRALLDARRG